MYCWIICGFCSILWPIWRLVAYKITVFINQTKYNITTLLLLISAGWIFLNFPAKLSLDPPAIQPCKLTARHNTHIKLLIVLQHWFVRFVACVCAQDQNKVYFFRGWSHHNRTLPYLLKNWEYRTTPMYIYLNYEIVTPSKLTLIQKITFFVDRRVMLKLSLLFLLISTAFI